MSQRMSMLLAPVAAILICCSCRSSQIEKTQDQPVSVSPKEVEVIVLCSGEGFFTDEKTFRANSVGESIDQNISKRKAMTNARSELASAIQITVKAVTDSYVNSKEFNSKEQVEERFESLGREVVNQKLTGIRVICERQTITTDGRYKTYVAIELSADQLVAAYHSRLSEDTRLKIDYDYEKFKKTFEAEMLKIDKSN